MPGVPKVTAARKAEAVAAYRSGGGSMAEVAKRFGVNKSSLSRWVKASDDRTPGPGPAQATSSATPSPPPPAELVLFDLPAEPTAEVRARICGHLFNLATWPVAAEAAGVPRETYAEWIEQGTADWRAGQVATPHARLWFETMQASSQGAARLAACQAAAADAGEWRAGLELLKRKHRSEGYGDRVALEAPVKASDGGAEVLGMVDQVQKKLKAG